MKFLKVLRNIFRMIFNLFYYPIFFLVYKLIEIVTYERGCNGILTLRKVKRMRFFLKLKIFLYKHFRRFIWLIQKEEMYKGIYETMNWDGV